MDVVAAELKTNDIPFGIYYTEGNDVYWQKVVLDAFRSLVPSDSLSLYVFDKLTSLEEVFTALDTFGFGDNTVVIVKDPDYKPSDREHNALASLNAEEAYVLFLDSKFLNAKEKKRYNRIDCNKIDRYACIRLATALFKYGIDRNALDRLVDLTDCDMARINIEADKLFDYCGARKVTLADVEETVIEDAEAQIFSFVSDLVEGRKANALKTLAKLKKRGEAPSYMLASLIGQYRRMLHASLSKRSDAELAGLMNVKEYAIKKARSSRRLGKKQLKSTVEMLVGYELKFKSGEMSDKVAFDAAIGRLIGEES